jgi:hypothetical protein
LYRPKRYDVLGELTDRLSNHDFRRRNFNSNYVIALFLVVVTSVSINGIGLNSLQIALAQQQSQANPTDKIEWLKVNGHNLL